MKKKIINSVASLLLVLISSPLSALEVTDINQAIRDKGANWVAGETSLSKLPPEEIRRLFMPQAISPLNLIGEMLMATVTSQALKTRSGRGSVPHAGPSPLRRLSNRVYSLQAILLMWI
jgi:hypothetical protein